MRRSSTNFLAKFGNFHSRFRVTKKWPSSEPSGDRRSDEFLLNHLNGDLDAIHWDFQGDEIAKIGAVPGKMTKFLDLMMILIRVE